jgi:hypothetical protein
MSAFAKEQNQSLTAELSTLREQLRLTNEMLADARRIELFHSFHEVVIIERDEFFDEDGSAEIRYKSILQDSSTTYSIDYYTSILDAFAAIREQQGD